MCSLIPKKNKLEGTIEGNKEKSGARASKSSVVKEERKLTQRSEEGGTGRIDGQRKNGENKSGRTNEKGYSL